MYIDLFLIVLFLWAVFSGWRNGVVKELLHTGGVLTGLLLSLGCYAFLGKNLTVDGTKVNMVLSIMAFFILCILLPIALGFVANRFNSLLRHMKLGVPNSLLGAAVSVLKFLFIISFAFNIMENLHIMNPERTETSRLYEPTRGFLSFVRDESAVRLNHRSEDKVDNVETKNDTTYIYFNRKTNVKKSSKLSN